MSRKEELWADFPALQLVRTGRLARSFGRMTFVGLVIALVAMFFVPWRQTARGTGVVLALDPQERPQTVTSGAKGIVDWVKPGLREGSYVQKGDPLVRLAPFAPEGVSQAESQVANIKDKLDAAQSNRYLAEQARELQVSSGENLIRSLDQDVQAARQKWEQSKNEVMALQAELEDKRNQLRIAEDVAARGLVSREELFSKRQAAEAQFNKVLKAEGAVEEAFAVLSSKEAEIESKKQEVDIKNRAAEQKVYEEIQKINTIQKELTDLEAKRGEFNRLDIVAPRSGYIQQWSGLEGSDAVKEGDAIFVIVPDATQLAVEMKVSGLDMPLIQEGAPVRLQFEGWPAVQIVGWPSVAVGFHGGKVNRVFPTDDGKGFFRVVVTPDHHFDAEKDWPDSRYLRQGVRANGWVLLQQVPLGYEIWRQLNGFPPEISDADSKAPKAKDLVPKIPKA